jgi:AsmA protein
MTAAEPGREPEDAPMKKILIGLAAIVVLLIAAVFIVPSVINWKSYEPEIAKAVRDATGRELHIDGDISVSVLPLSVSIGAFRLSNVEGMPSPDMISVAGVDVKLALFPLIVSSVVVESLVVREPAIFLEVDESGRPNWLFEPAAPAPAAPAPAEAGLPISGLELADVRIEDGLFSFIDATTGQTVQAHDIDIKIALANLTSALTIVGSAVLNDENVTLDVSVDSPQAILGGDRAKIKFTLATKHISITYDGDVQQKPVPGLDGSFDVDVPSVGALAAWLGRPLDASQPDPGPLTVHAAFAADGAKATLEEATIKGEALEAKASGSFDASGQVAKIVLNVESDVLDIDRYLPPPSETPRQKAEMPVEHGKPGDALAAIPDAPFDLSGLRQTEADINVAIGGIKAKGFEIGRIALVTTLKGGVVDVKLSELGLYGGNVKGTVKLDGATDVLGVELALAVAGVDVGALAKAATGETPVAGILSMTVEATGKGANPRALVESLAGNVIVDLGGIDVKDAPVGAISEVKLAIALPGIESPPSVKGSVVYNEQRVNLDVTLDSLGKVLAGETFALTAAIASKHINLAYDGAVQQPVPGLDGVLDVDVPSVGKLAAWLGQPLDASQPDPGPLTVHAVFAADGAKVALEEATIEGKALKVNVKGSFDGSGEVAQFAADVVVELADLNAYLPPEKEGEAAAEAEAAPAGKKAEGWSEEPIDFSPLKQANGEAKITIGKILYKEVTIENGVITVSVQNGVLNAAIDKLGVAGGTVDIKVTIDASQPKAVLAFQATIANTQALPLLKSFAGTDRLSGTANFNANGQAVGSNQKQIVETLNGGGGFKFLDGAIHGINIAETIRSLGSLGFGEEGPPQKTDFAEISGTFNIVNGLLENRDFQMLAPLLRVTGAGLVPLPPQTVDYNAELKLVASTAGQGGDAALAGLPIPVSITGPWADPSYDVDWGSLLGAAALDPARLAAMPDDMLEAAKGFGVDLPLPDLAGDAGSGIGGTLDALIGGLLDTVTGGGSQETTTEEPAEEDKSLLEGAGDALKSLFGN